MHVSERKKNNIIRRSFGFYLTCKEQADLNNYNEMTFKQKNFNDISDDYISMDKHLIIFLLMYIKKLLVNS